MTESIKSFKVLIHSLMKWFHLKLVCKIFNIDTQNWLIMHTYTYDMRRLWYVEF